MDPGSIPSTVKKIANLGRSALSQSEKEELLSRFSIQTTDHSLQQLDMFLAAFKQHSAGSGELQHWQTALDDESLPTSARVEALLGLREAFARMIRATYDPILGNKMLALASAGFAQLDYPNEIVSRALLVAAQLVPEDVDLLRRYVTEGTTQVVLSPDGDPVFYYKNLVQEDLALRFVDSSGALSKPLDPFSYSALKRTEIITDHPWMGDPEIPRGKPRTPSRIGQNGAHPAFKLEWRLTTIGLALLESFSCRSLQSLPKLKSGRIDLSILEPS